MKVKLRIIPSHVSPNKTKVKRLRHSKPQRSLQIVCVLMAIAWCMTTNFLKDSSIVRMNESNDAILKQLKRIVSSRYIPMSKVSVGTFMLVNEGAIDLYRNFLHYFNQIEGKWQVYVGTTSKSVISLAKDVGHKIIEIEFSELSSESLDFGNRDYQMAIYARTRIINILLQTNSYTYWLVADVDAVWLCNPYEMIFHLYGNEPFDIGGQMDGPNLCGGFLMLRANKAVQNVWNNMTDLYYESILSNKVDGSIDNTEQGILKRLLNKEMVAVKEFDRDIFPSGHDYFIRGRRNKACVVHNNYIIGIEKKIQRFRDVNLWQVR